MKFNLIEKTLTALPSITAPTVSEWIDVTGCDSLAIVMTASAASTPGTATIQLEASLDKTNLTLLGSTVSVAANGSYVLTADRPIYRYYRVRFAIASGSYTAAIKVLAKGDKG